jgi:DMSO reductase family type II enzyme chaperone
MTVSPGPAQELSHMNGTQPLRADTRDLAQTRQDVYRFLRSALTAPTPEQHVWLSDERFAPTLEALCGSFDLPCPAGPLVPAGFADHQSRYLACFEVGMPGPPVPLVASHYNQREPVPRIIHEHILFYRTFGVQLPADCLEQADHLVHQLAFLIHLDRLLIDDTFAATSILRARHDFLSRHLVRWVGAAARAAEEKHLPPLYCSLLDVLSAAVEQDRDLTVSALATLVTEQP